MNITHKTSRRSALMGSAATLLASFALGTGAIAQDADSENIEEVVVTGSLIRNPNLVRSAPVAVLSAEEMKFQQTTVAEEILRDIPGVVPSIGQQVNNGNGGFSYVNLRGLGSNRNIVLIDGQRLSPSELNGRFDLNNIPIALIERADVLTGGASTTYGADAVAGVVNFITRKNFTGIELNTSYSVTEEGDGDKQNFELTMGADLDDGKGNAVLSIGYQDVEPIFQGDRAFSEYLLFKEDGSRGGSSFGSFNTGFANVNPTGVKGGDIVKAGVQPDGETLANGVVPFNYAPFNTLQTPFKRYNIYAAADYEITEGLEAYTRAIFSRNTVVTLIAPSGAFGNNVDISLNHPFMSDAQRNAFCAFDTNAANIGSEDYVPRFTQSECDAAATATDPSDPNYRQVNTDIFRRNVEGGPRISDYVADYFDYQAGLRGNVTDSINFDIFASYGQSEQTQLQQGYWMKSRIKQALLAGPDGCFDTSDGCVPADYFGYTGSITDDMNAFLAGGESVITTRFDMGQVVGNINGEIGYTLPWATDAVNFAIGGEYRSYSASRESDLLSQSGDLSGAGGAAPNIEGGYSVYEAVAEVAVPLVQDAAFAKQLSLEAGIRYSDYTVDAPSSPSYSTTTWKFGTTWAPVNDISFRATFARAVRAPNILELYRPLNVLLTDLDVDPCASVNDAGVNSGFVPTGALRDVCIAQGAPAGAIGFIPQPAVSQANSTIGGDINLQPEKSDSWTLGVILQPEAVPGLTVTLDYYNIKIDGAINAPTSGDAIEACFDDPDPTSEACLGISRSPSTGSLSGDSSIVGGLPLFLSNTGNLATDGVDVSISYTRDFDDIQWRSSFNGNWTNKSTFQAVTGVSFNRDCVGLYSGNCQSIQPEYTFNWRNTVSYDNLDVSLLWRYISNNEYETGGAFVGEPEGDLGEWDFNKTGTYSLFDLTFSYQLLENLSLTSTISNLFDKHPPLTSGTVGATGYNSANTYPSTYDTHGRRFGISAKVSF